MKKIRQSRKLFADNLVSSLPAEITERPLLQCPARQITICHPVWRLDCGGLERQLVQTVNHLPRDEFRHVVLVRGWDETSERLADELGDHVDLIKQAGPTRDRIWSRRLACILREYEVDVLHVRGLSMLFDSVLAAELYGDTSVAFSFHGFESTAKQFDGVRRKIFREATLRCDARWSVGPTAAQSVARTLNLPRESFEVIANGVDTDRYRPTADQAAVRQKLGLPNDRLVMLTVGNLKPIKGHDILLKAMQKLDAASDRISLIMVGADDLNGSLQQWASDHLQNNDVRFVGQQSDVLPWYQAADVFVLPSLSEGLSNALLEAMACGLPVIATNVGGNQDVIQHESNGLLIEAGRPENLAAAMARLINEAELRSDLARTARDHVRQGFSLSNTIKTYAAHYRQLVDFEPAQTTEPLTAEAV